MRLFIAIALPPEASAALARIRQQFEPIAGPDLRWSAPEGWHITLQFLGPVADNRVPCILDQLRTIHAAPVPIRIRDLGFFDRAGVFWAGIVMTQELLALQQLVTVAMRPCGFVPEDRAYNPHITLARTKGRAGSRALDPLKKAIAKSKPTVGAEFTAGEFLLYESFPTPEGSRYEVHARFPLQQR